MVIFTTMLNLWYRTHVILLYISDMENTIGKNNHKIPGPVEYILI